MISRGKSLTFRFIPWKELLIISSVVLLVAYYFDTPDRRIFADGQGYYDYLPSALIRHDLVRYNKDVNADSSTFAVINSLATYVPYGEGKVDKYFCGTAVLIAPVFIVSSWFAEPGDDGYSQHYQNTVYVAALLYLFLALIFLRLLLKKYEISSRNIFVTQVLMVFATSILHYTYCDSTFSHIYSLFAITAFLYCAKSWMITPGTKHLVLMGALLGLICIIRPVNVLVVLFLPFLAGSFAQFRQSIAAVFTNRKGLVLAIAAFVLIVAIQCVLWFLQTGDFILYSYQEEGFNFSKPEIGKVLFSYQKGLFVYTPILLLSFLGVAFLVGRKQYYLSVTWFLFVLFLVYILSSWHAWAYGCSFGQRPFIDFYPVFFLPVAIMLQRMNRWLQVGVVLSAMTAIPVAVIQTYQYNAYILHWELMNKEKYWRVFLETDPQWRGLIWKRTYSDWEWVTEKTETRNSFVADPFTGDTIFKAAMRPGDFDRPRLMRVEFDHEFPETELSQIELNIRDSVTGNLNYSAGIYLQHFADQSEGKLQHGIYNYAIPVYVFENPQVVTVKAFTGDKELVLRNCRFTQLKWK